MSKNDIHTTDFDTTDFDSKLLQLETGIKVIRNYTANLKANPEQQEDVMGRMKEFEMYIQELAGMAGYMNQLEPIQIVMLQDTITEFRLALEGLLSLSKSMSETLSDDAEKSKKHVAGASAYLRASGSSNSSKLN